MFFSTTIETPLGTMLAVADDHALYMLEFTDSKGFAREIASVGPVTPGITAPLESIQHELADYFAGSLKRFQTPLAFSGTAFQEFVWNMLLQIPYGQTCSYAALATTIGQPKAYRAVANANAANRLSIIVPCHRVIQSNGHLGGYDGGVSRKAWLLDHER